MSGNPPHRVPPWARLEQNAQFASQTSAQVAQELATLQACTPEQHFPLQQTFGAAQPAPASPFSLVSTAQEPLAELHVWQTGQTAGQVVATQLPP